MEINVAGKQQSCELIFLQVHPIAHNTPLNNLSLILQHDCNLLQDHGPEPPRE